ncbi:AraC family transcriptional regulator [Clostridium grantii]|uniref:AraC-type DNA-binding protein n=1 Tax=Clostridium grantii DSM 8605 TaxID=1121316 RepID=A0A1M5SY10_9CLOT|nr:AraC family transcriptional regulator [Clostridium grantii]SHH43365.1 AraC-type DNA-binding protein [Clostridium grantii DSM 8605]
MLFEFPVLNSDVYNLPFYISELGFLENQDHVIRNNTFDKNQILVCSGGKGKLIVNNKEYIISNKNIFLIEKNVPHEYFSISKPWKINWVVFDGTYIPQLLKQLNIENHEVFELSSIKSIANIFEESLLMLKSNNNKKHIECSILIYTLITKLSYCKRINSAYNHKTKKQMTFEKIIIYLEENYDKDISLEDISKALGISTYYICRIFKAYNPVSLITYLNQYRISMSKKILLQNPQSSIKDIGIQTGFKDPSYFSAIFKKVEGISPIEFRQQHGFH